MNTRPYRRDMTDEPPLAHQLTTLADFFDAIADTNRRLATCYAEVDQPDAALHAHRHANARYDLAEALRAEAHRLTEETQP